MNYTADPDEVVWFDGATRTNVPSAWQRFASAADIAIISNGTIFLHQRRNQNGELRLVAVDLVSINTINSTERPPQLTFWGRVIHPGGIVRRPSDQSIRRLRNNYGYTTEFAIMAGQPDPDDPTHFTIECYIDGERVVIDGWLMDDDTVLLEKRPGWTNPAGTP